MAIELCTVGLIEREIEGNPFSICTSFRRLGLIILPAFPKPTLHHRSSTSGSDFRTCRRAATMAVWQSFFLLLVLLLVWSSSSSYCRGALLASDTPAAAATAASAQKTTERHTAPVERVSAGGRVGGAGGLSGGGSGGGRPGGGGDTEGYYNGGSRTSTGGTPSLLNNGGKVARHRHSGASRTYSGRLPMALAATAMASLALRSTT